MSTQPRLRRPIGLVLVAAAVVGIVLQFGSAPASRAMGGNPSASKRQALAAYAKLPLAFTANAGQTDPRVRYSAQGAGFSVFLTRKEAMLDLRRPGTKDKRKGAALALRFLGSNPNVAIRGERPGSGRVTYLLGNDPARWHTGLRTYERVVYRNLWPGVDMLFMGQSGKLKVEFRVRPGARLRDIRLAYRGAKRLSLDRRGNLRIGTSLGVFIDTRPASYQLIAGTRVPVRSSFTHERRGSGYGFALGRGYDRHHTLVIDPGLVYSTYLGGGGYDAYSDIALDDAGNAYVTGITWSADFPTTTGAFDETYDGGDAFVTKLDASGAALVYSTYLGGSDSDGGFAVVVDGAGSAYVTGQTGSTDFPTTPSAFDRTFNGGADAFVTKLDASGAALGYSTYLGGAGYDAGLGLAVDGAGSASVTGATTSTDFPTTPGAFDTTFNDDDDNAFVTKLDASGALEYSTFLGTGFGNGVALDGEGNAYVTGAAYSADFPTTAGAFDTTFSGGDAFVTKLDASGAALVYSTFLGGSDFDVSQGIALDGAGNAYVTGFTGSSDFPTTAGAFDTTYNGGYDDAFVTKLDASGAALAYSTYLGGSDFEWGADVALDGAGNAYVTGLTYSSDFPTALGAFDTTLNGDTDAFVTKLDASGAALAYSTYLGGSGSDVGRGITVDGTGSAYATGYTGSADFPTTAGAFDTSYNGGANDAFVTKLDLAGPPPPPPPPIAQCVVPRVIGWLLPQARKRIREAHCRVGKITRVRSTRENKNRVLAQSPPPGTLLEAGARVSLTVGRGRR